MVASLRNDERGLSDGGKRKELALDLQRELEREFMLDQLQELSTDFADNPEQIGLYLADLEVAGLLTPADKGMVFRRLWETMGPAFADRAFGMTARAVIDGDLLAAEIASDAFVDVSGGRATFSDPAEFERMREASSALSALASALGLKIDVPTPELKRRPDHIQDIDPERAHKTAEVLGSLGSQLGLDTNQMDVRVDEEARAKTAGQGIWGLMTDGTVFLDPELYDPETTAGRHLLAHEVVHVAQLENRLRGANDAPDLYQAEAEADTLSAMFAETGNVGAAPLASLARYDQAACGPREMGTPDKEPDPRPGKTEVEREPPIYDIVDNGWVIPIRFKVDKDQIKDLWDETDLAMLEKAAATIKAYPQITAMDIEGHTSTTATAEYNQGLSERRANSVTQWLGSTGGVSGVAFTPVGKGEQEAREELGIKDDRTSSEVTAHRKVRFQITEVDGKAVPKDWKPTRKVISVPGKTITRTYDADGNLLSEEIVVDTPGGAEAQTTAPTAPVNATDSNQSAPAGQATTSTGDAAPSVEPNSPAAQQQAPASQQPAVKPKMKPLKPGPKIKARRNPAWLTSAITSQVFQAKAGANGLSAGSIDNTTRSSGAGEALSSGVRTRFESAFGADFSDVRVHRGSAQASGIGAAAFARGTDIHFAPGRFDTDSSNGLAILGHELTHIVQQRAGRVAVPQGKGTHINVERTLEAEADLLGSRAARGESVQVQGSSAGLYARAARGGADTIQYKDEGGAAGEAGTRPEHAEVRLGGQRIRARMPAGGASPGRITVDFSSAASVPGLSLTQASLVFDDQWEITEGHIMASIAIGSYVNCQDVRLTVRQREDGTGKYAELAAEVNDADFKIDGLLDSKINLRLATSGVSGTAHVNFADLTIGQNMTLTGGTLDFALTEAGEATVSGSVNGTITVGEVTANIELRGEAMSNGNLSAGAKISLAQPVPVPGVEGVTIKSGEINGSYVHNQEWTLNGNLVVNVRDWVEADITASYKQPAEGAAQWELNGTLRQLQPYSLGTPEAQITLENGELDLHFVNGEFVSVAARTDWSTTNFTGRLTGDYKVQEQLLNGQGAVSLAVPELPVGTDGIKFTRIEAVLMLEDNVLKTITGGATCIFPYDNQDTFKLDGTDFIFNVPDQKVTGTATVTTLRELDFGDTAAYNAKIATGAVGTLSVADNNLLGISGGLAFDVNHGAGKIGEGTVDINFDGPTQQLNATANFTLTDENGFGVPNRETGPVMLKPGGQFRLSIVDSALGAATITGVGFEVKQEGEGATGKIEGEVSGSYDFQTEKLTAIGNAHLSGDWPLEPVDGVTIVFKEGGQLDVAVVDNVLTSVHGAFPYEATIGAQGTVPEIQLTGSLNGDYSGESKKFGGTLEGALVNEVVIPVGEDSITVKPGATFTAAITDNVPATFSAAFDVDYTRQGTLFCAGHVENASYDFRTGHFGFEGNLTLKTKIEKQTDDGKWKFVVNEESTVGVKVEESELRLITGSIPFEIHDEAGALFNGNLTNAELNVQDLKFTGTLDVGLARDLTYPRSPEGGETAPEGEPPVQAVAKKDVSRISGQITNNALTEVSAVLMFGVNLGGEEYGAGELTGNINMASFQFAGTGKINLVKDLVMGGNEENAQGDPIASWHLVFPAGQGLDIAIAANQLDEANLNLNAKLLHNGEEVANGAVNGRYKLGDTAGFCGEINANVIKDVDLTEDERFHYWLETGTTFRAVMNDNAIDSATGNFQLRLDEIPEGNRQAVRVAISGGYTKGPGFAAEGSVTVLNDLKIGEGDEFKFFIGKDSAGGAAVAGTKVTSFTGDFTVKVNKGEDPFALGTFNLNYNHTDAAAQLNCEGQVDLLARTDVTPDGLVDWKFFLDPATGVAFKVTNNNLEYVKGQVNFGIQFKNVDSVNGNLYVEYLHTPTKEVNANGQMNVIADMRVADDLPGGLKMVIEPGTGASFNVEHSALQTITGTVKVRVEDEEPLCRVEMNGTYTHTPAPNFEGSGGITLIRDIEVGSSDDGKYTFNVLSGTGATATIAESKLTQITGSLIANIEDQDSEFARLEGTVTANKLETWKITAEGVGLTCNRDKEFDVRDSWTVTLLQGSGITATVRDNNLESLGGTIGIKVDKGEELSAKISLGGEYTPGGGFTGEGSAELLEDYNVGTSAPYSFIATKGGTEAHINVAASAVQRVGGRVNFLVKKGEEDFITGFASIDYDVAGLSLIEARGEGVLANDTTLGDASGFTLVACQNSSAHFLAQTDALVNVGGNLNLRLDEGTAALAEGVVNAEFDVQGSSFTGDGKVTLVRDYAVNAEGLNGHGQPESWGLAIKTGSELNLSIVENVFQQAHIDVSAVGYHNGEQCADGSLTADYTIGETGGVSGHVELNVTRRVPLLEGSGRFDYHIDTGSGFSADVAQGTLTTATVTVNLAATEGAVDKVLVNATGTYTAGEGVTGTGSINVVDPILIKDGEWKLFLDAGSGGNATVTASELEEINGNVNLRVDKGEEPFARGEFGVTYRVADGENADVTATGRVSLIGRVEVTPSGGVGGFSVFLCGGSNIGAGITNGDLDYVDGQILGEVEHGGGVWANIDLQARYQASGTEDFSGSGSITTIAPLEVTDFAGYTLFLGVGASITGTITAFELDELTANIPLEMHKDGTKTIEATLNGNYKHSELNFSGEGSVTVVKQITIAEGVGSKGYSFYLEPSSGVSGSVANNAVEQITGNLVVLVADSPSADAAFLKATAQATYHGGDAPTVDANGGLEVIRDFEMLTTDSGYVVWLKVGSGCTVDVTANELNQIGGTIKVEVQKDGGAFAKIDLGGTYTPDGGFNGQGTAELCTEINVVEDITIGDESYSVWVLPGTGAIIDLAASDITHVGGTVHAMIRDGAGDFIQIDAQADYDFPGANLSGSGSITVLKPKQLAEFDGNTLWLAEGSGISGSMANNNLQRVDGTLNLQLKDASGHWLTVEFNGGYDAEGGTGFTGTGTVTVLMDKKLADVGDYSFWLAEGAGASAKIEQNQLTEVHGAIPFKVFDAEPLPLIRGQAEGHYYASTGLFSGSGEVYLARDVEYPLGEGMLVFKEGSGGGGTVTDNELERLTGVLKVDIHDKDGAMVGCEADGVYNAVTNTIERLYGTATLLRPIEVGGTGDNAMIRIDELSGSALVENNELKELSGSLTICMPRFNNATGHFEGGWQKGAGEDIFWGSGWIEVTLFDDPGKGRKASGRVEGTYNKDGTFQVSGEIEYKLNQMIGGSVGMTVDQELDPILEGTLEITEVPLVPGRDLFKWGKEFNLFQVTAWAGPVPIDISGGVNVGIGLSMLPLTFSASIGVTNFRPLSQDVQVPDFTAHAELNTGLRMSAKLQPWAQLGVGIAGVASAGIALQGEAGVNVDVNVSPFADLTGEGGVYSGKLGVGLEIVGSGSLALMPQVYAQLLGKRWPYDLAEIRHDLGDLFSYSYDFAFPFGDQPSAPTAGSGAAPSTTTAAASTSSVSHETKPAADPATSGTPNRPGAVPGGPDMNAAGNDAEQAGEKEGPMAEMMAKIDSIQAWGEKIGTVAKVGGELVSCLMFVATLGLPAGLIVAAGYLGYKFATGELTMDEIVSAATTVWELIQEIDLSGLTKLLPDWLVSLWNYIKDKSLDDLVCEMIDWVCGTLRDWFPSAEPVIEVIETEGKNVVRAMGRIVRAVLDGAMPSLDDFLTIAKGLGGGIAIAVVEMLATIAYEAAADAAGAVVDFVASLW